MISDLGHPRIVRRNPSYIVTQILFCQDLFRLERLILAIFCFYRIVTFRLDNSKPGKVDFGDQCTPWR